MKNNLASLLVMIPCESKLHETEGTQIEGDLNLEYVRISEGFLIKTLVWKS